MAIITNPLMLMDTKAGIVLDPAGPQYGNRTIYPVSSMPGDYKILGHDANSPKERQMYRDMIPSKADGKEWHEELKSIDSQRARKASQAIKAFS